MLPGLLMTVGSFDISPKGYGVIREHALHFIKHLMAHVSWTTIRLNFDVVSERSKSAIIWRFSFVILKIL